MELEKGINFYTLLHVLHGQNIFVYLVYFVVRITPLSSTTKYTKYTKVFEAADANHKDADRPAVAHPVAVGEQDQFLHASTRSTRPKHFRVFSVFRG